MWSTRPTLIAWRAKACCSNRDRGELNILAQAYRVHGYLNSPTQKVDSGGIPQFEVNLGKGKITVSEMNIEAEGLDSIARRLMNNLIGEL